MSTPADPEIFTDMEMAGMLALRNLQTIMVRGELDGEDIALITVIEALQFGIVVRPIAMILTEDQQRRILLDGQPLTERRPPLPEDN